MSDMGKLDGKVALITGGTTGIGAASARLFQAEGATVIVTGANPATAKAADLPGVEIIISDQADTAASKALIETVAAKHGRIDVLFVNAGIGRFAPLAAVDEASFDRQFAVNVRGVYFLIQAAAPAMADGGSIILTGSVAGSQGSAMMSVYGATKAALRSFGRTLATELLPRGIRVNTISPGPIETPIFGKTGMSRDQVDAFLEGAKTRIPMGRVGQAEEVAAAALYFAADATFVTGSELILGGGLGYL